MKKLRAGMPRPVPLGKRLRRQSGSILPFAVLRAIRAKVAAS
ncbi:hypothetical protein [Sphingopyxis terrae]